MHPLTKQRSSFVRTGTLDVLGADAEVFERNVHDGKLRAIVGLEPDGWHLSLSMHRPGGVQRYPTWDELAHARYKLVPDDVEMVMHLPPPEAYVSLHDTTFHLFEYRGES